MFCDVEGENLFVFKELNFVNIFLVVNGKVGGKGRFLWWVFVGSWFMSLNVLLKFLVEEYLMIGCNGRIELFIIVLMSL